MKAVYKYLGWKHILWLEWKQIYQDETNICLFIWFFMFIVHLAFFCYYAYLCTNKIYYDYYYNVRTKILLLYKSMKPDWRVFVFV